MAREASLTDRSLAAAKWNYLGVLVRAATQLLVQIALARLLGPDAFGLIAFTLLVVSVGGIVVEMGLGAALVQKRDASNVDVQIVFTRVMMVGILATLAAYGSASHLATFFGDPRIATVMRWMSLVFAMQALSVTSLSLLRRELAFKSIQGVQIGSYVVGFLAVGLGLALLGAGVWSLVAAWIAQSGLAAASYYALTRHSVRLRLAGGDPAMSRFGLRVVCTNIANWVTENIDNLLVGKMFGSAALGVYSVSYNLVRVPTNHLVVTMQTVLFPASARAQDNLSGLRRAYLTVLSAVSLFALPVFLGIAVSAGTVIDALFGSAWSGANAVLTPLAIGMTFHALMAIAGPVLLGKGNASAELTVQVMVASVLFATLLVVGRWSVAAMAWAVCGVYAIRFIAMTLALARSIQLPTRAFFTSVRGAIIAAAATTSLLAALEAYLVSLAAVPKLLTEVTAASFVLALFVVALPGIALSNELAFLVHRLATRIPNASGWLKHVRATHPDVDFGC